MIGAIALLMQERPEELLEKFGAHVTVQLGEDQLISQAYQMLGQTDHAKSILQASTYQHIFLTISNSTSSLLLTLDNLAQFEKIVLRTYSLISDWAIQKLNTNIALSFYLIAATGYMQLQHPEKAMEMLKHYTKTCEQLRFPLQLRGDDYFDLIEEWLTTTMQLSTITPRDDASVKHDLLATVTKNPVFTALHERKDFQLLIANLQHLIERKDTHG